MKNLLPLIFLAFLINSAYSQTYNMNTINGQTITTCSGTFFDSGGATGGYGNSQNLICTFCSNSTINDHVKLYFDGNFSVDPSDTLFIYDGPNTTAPLIGKYNNNNTLALMPIYSTINNPGGCLTLRFQSNGTVTSSGWSATIQCIPICQQVIAALDSINMVPMPADSNYIDVCYGDTITFVGKGIYPQNNIMYAQHDTSSMFIWAFGDGTYDTGQIVKHLYNTVRGYNIQLMVKDVNGCSSMNSLGTRVRISSPPIAHVSQVPSMCSGDTAIISAGYTYGNTVSIYTPSYYQSASLAYDSSTFIPDGGALGGQCYNTNVTFNVFNPGQTVTSSSDILGVCVGIEHSFNGDLEFKLYCPNGQNTVLKTYIGGSQPNCGNYLGEPLGGANHANFDCTTPPSCISDPAQNPPGTGWTYCWSLVYPQVSTINNYPSQPNNTVDSTDTINHTHYYTPDQNFSNLVGCPLNGTWNLQICDYWGIDNGWVFWWKLDLDPNLLPTNWGYSVPVDTISWTGPYIIHHTSTDITIAPDTGGVFYYTTTILDQFGCGYDTTVAVHVTTTPAPDLGPDTTLCFGAGTVLLDAGIYSNPSYFWLPGQQTSQTISADQTGTYIVNVDNKGNGLTCSKSDTILITFGDPVLVSFKADTIEGCQPVTVTFTNNTYPDYVKNFLWDFGDGTTDTAKNPSHVYPDPGNYSINLKAISDVGCSGEYTVNNLVKVYAQPEANFTVDPDRTVLLDEATLKFTDGSINPSHWEWDFGDGSTSTEQNPSHTYTKADTFDVLLKVFNDFGCWDTLHYKAVVIENVQDSLEIPNVFTPNGDGKNDKFYIKALDIHSKYYVDRKLVVYNRWGKKVYENNYYDNNWDGKGLDDGAYYYVFNYTFAFISTIKQVQKSGSVTILR